MSSAEPYANHLHLTLDRLPRQHLITHFYKPDALPDTQPLTVLFCSLAILDPRVGHTMDVLSPFISILCHSDWLFHRESCPRLDVVYPGRVVFLACVHLALFLALFLSPGTSLVSSWCDHSMLASSLASLFFSNSSPLTPALLRTHSFVFFAVHETRRIFLSPFISKKVVR